jgi:purine-binding chemotaxis protein CheW
MSRDIPLTLVCRVRDLRVAIDLAFISETMRPLSVSAVAGMPSFVAGLAVVRGVPTVVVDAGALLASAGAPAWTRFVALRSTAGPVVLAVEAVVGVRALDVASLRALPPLLGLAHTETVAAIGVRDRELLVLLDAARVVPDAVWTALERVGAPA